MGVSPYHIKRSRFLTGTGNLSDPCGCLKQVLGIETAAGIGLAASGLPVKGTRGKTRGATKGTSFASEKLSKMFPRKLNKQVPAPTANSPRAKSNILGRVLGRWTPFVGWGILAVDLAQLKICVKNCQEQGVCSGEF